MHTYMNKSFRKGFTLIELLIVIAIIAIIAAVAFVALDPLTRFQDSRDASRWSDISAVLAAIKVDQVDNGGSYVSAVASTTAGTSYMIGDATSGCNVTCTAVSGIGASNCVDLSALVTEGYLSEVPVSPNASGSSWTTGTTGYVLTRESTGILEIEACDAENASEVRLAR